MQLAQKQTVLGFMKKNPLAVIATNSTTADAPESALIAFAELPNLGIIFETFSETRKHDNLQKNNHVSLVIGWGDDQITLQYEGIARPIPKNETEKYLKIFAAKDTPCTEVFLRNPRVRLYKVKPTWLRYSNYSCETPEFIEHRFEEN